MKIKDILNNNSNFKTRLLIARRIMKCTNLMKREIAYWKRTNIVPNRKLSLEVDGMEKMTISIHQLTNTYGMDALSAMLFFDDLIKANISDDKTQLINLAERLQNGQRRKPLTVTPNMMDKIRQDQPELWAEYQSLLKAEVPDREEAKQECVNIGEAEMPD